MVEDRLSKANAKLSTYRTALSALQGDAKASIDIFIRMINELDLKEGKLQT